MLATILGGLLGFVPGFVLISDLGGGFMQAPGLILTLIFLVVILNANLAVFGLTLLGAKILSLPLMPVSFGIGRLLLDGPTSGLFEMMINAPILAWFGLEHYATTGGLVAGAAFGTGVGLAVLRGIRVFRARMAGVEEGSELYKKLTGMRSVRFLTWVFLGKGKGKKSYLELLESDKRGMPIRIPGVILVAVLTVGMWLGLSFLGGPALRNALQGGLESYNGATVDLAGAEVNLGSGRFVISGLAMADRNDLVRDSFRARSLEMQVSTGELLRKRLVVDSITSSEASTGEVRSTPGELLVDPEEPPPPPPPAPDSKTLEEYIADAQAWKDRLQQVARWLEKLSGSDEATEDVAEEVRNERMKRVAEEQGLARVVASHLIQGSPRVLIRSLVFEGVVAADLEGDLLDIRASNLSTSPRLVDEAVTLSVGARSGAFSFDFELDAAAARTANASFRYRGLPVDVIASQLRTSPMAGGTMDVSLSSAMDFSRPGGIWIDFPLDVTLHDTTLGLRGQQTRVDELTLSLGLRGPLRSPQITISDQALADALVAAGKRELAAQVRGRAGELLEDKLPPDVGQRAEETVRGILPGGLPPMPGGILGGRQTPPPMPENARGHWIHSVEEDTAGEEVYRRNGYAFPDGPPRRGFQIGADGEFVEHPTAPPGNPVRGRWTAQEGAIRVEFPGTAQQPYTFRILSADGDVLKIRRGG